jgi:hypothetical protein
MDDHDVRELSEQMKDAICKWCIHQDGINCLCGVPYYAVSMACAFFEEGEVKTVIKRKPSKKRLMNKVLVETF